MLAANLEVRLWDNNLNFDDASLVFDSAPCVTSQLTLQKTWVNANIGDTASVRASRGGTIIDTLASSAATANETDVDATPVQVFEGEAIDLSEVMGAGNGRLYASALTCTGGGALSGTTLTVGNTGTPVICRYTNTGPSADVSITKTNTPGVNGDVDQATDTVLRGANTSYTFTVRNAGPSAANGTIVRDPATPSLSCSSATCGNAQGGAVCPAVTVAALQLPAGVTIATLPANSSLEITLTCTVLLRTAAHKCGLGSGRFQGPLHTPRNRAARVFRCCRSPRGYARTQSMYQLPTHVLPPSLDVA